MTQPTVIFFGPDTPRSPNEAALPKVFLRTLLFSTSKRGCVIENMYVTLARNETHQNFNVWVYGERDRLVRGSGLFVGEAGLAANHHFLAPRDAISFRFSTGHYRVEVFAHLLGKRKRRLLFSQILEVTPDVATQLQEPGTGLYFDWGPDALRYMPHIEKHPPSAAQRDFLERLLLSESRDQSEPA
jgi:hypothetical protein